LNYDTIYYWKIIAKDFYGLSNISAIWSFKTIKNQPPVFGTPSPVNGSTNQPISFTWSIPINDPEGDLFNWSIECSNGENSSDIMDGDGTKIA
jgi:hypothetical protein